MGKSYLAKKYLVDPEPERMELAMWGSAPTIENGLGELHHS